MAQTGESLDSAGLVDLAQPRCAGEAVIRAIVATLIASARINKRGLQRF